MKNRKVPEGTITRLCDYLRVLGSLERRGERTASSDEIGSWAGVKASQVRKDLSYFGEFGRRGLGYEVAGLRAHIQEILGVAQQRPAVVIGAGNLGSALARYPGFAAHGFQIVAIFDSDPERVGQLTGGMPIQSILDLAEAVSLLEAEIAILTVPDRAAQEAAEQVAAAGVKAIVNFAPVLLNLPPGVTVRNVDLAKELEILCYYLPAGDGVAEH